MSVGKVSYQSCKMYSTKSLQVEITSLCQAGCIDCNRWRPHQTEHDTQWQINGVHPHMQKYYPLNDWKQHIGSFESIKHIQFCGNMGDPMAHPDIVQICKETKKIFPDIFLDISTNGGLGRLENYLALAGLGVNITFAVDGLEDTNHIYRRGVIWKKVSERFRAFIDAGGSASWQYIVFPHNEHQVSEARKLSKQWGFKNFEVRERFTKEETFDKQIVESSTQPVDLQTRHQEKYYTKQQLSFTYDKNLEQYEDCKIVPGCTVVSEDDWHHPCPQINVDGTLWPCCYTATLPFHISQSTRQWYKSTTSHMQDGWNSLYHHTPEQIISSEWWQEILPTSWKNKTSLICFRHCGECLR